MYRRGEVGWRANESATQYFPIRMAYSAIRVDDLLSERLDPFPLGMLKFCTSPWITRVGTAAGPSPIFTNI